MDRSILWGEHPDVALAEVRPPVGSRAVVGEFELLRTVKLLDVSALETVYFQGSVFDPAFAGQQSLARFLGRSSDRITMPVPRPMTNRRSISSRR